MNVGESQIMQSLKVRDLVSHSTNFSTLMIILLLYLEAHNFILETLEKIRNLLLYNACSTIIHALISC